MGVGLKLGGLGETTHAAVHGSLHRLLAANTSELASGQFHEFVPDGTLDASSAPMERATVTPPGG